MRNSDEAHTIKIAPERKENVDEDKTEALIDILMEHLSIYDADKIKHDAYLTDRIKTDNTTLYKNIQTISNAMGKVLDGKKHIPKKIKFKYVKYSIQNIAKR